MITMRVTPSPKLFAAVVLTALCVLGNPALAQEAATPVPQESIPPEAATSVPGVAPGQEGLPLEEQAAPDGSITPPVIAVPPGALVPAPTAPLPDTEATYVINLRDADIRSLS